MDKFDLPVWSSDDVTSLLLIDLDATIGITNLLKFLIQNKGYVKDSTMDLMFVISSVVLFGQDNHIFKDAEKIVSLATEFCLVDTVYDNQTLEAIGLSDNSVLYLALQDETDAALEAAVRYLAYDFGPRGIKVNALSAGPLKTLAGSAAGVGEMLTMYQDIAPLCRNITHEEVGRSGAFLLSEFSSGITGEVLHIDGGYNAMGSPGRLLDKVRELQAGNQ